MSIWGIMWSYFKGLLCGSGRGGIVDYALERLNDILSKKSVSTKIDEAYSIALKVSEILHKNKDWCPSKWEKEFSNALSAVDCIIYAIEDKQLDTEELNAVINKFKVAYADWFSED